MSFQCECDSDTVVGLKLTPPNLPRKAAGAIKIARRSFKPLAKLGAEGF